MKLDRLLTFSLTSLLLIGSVGVLPKGLSANTLIAGSGPVAASQNVLKTGIFVKGEAPTQGAVRIVTEGGKQFIEIDQDFKTSEMGPDLHVILYRTDKPPISGIKEQDYVIISKLQKFSGSQRYEIPTSVDLSKYASTAIWCRKFNATFGYAKLGS